MWVWDARVAVDRGSRAQLLRFCREQKVRTLYFSAYRLDAPMDRVYRELNREAHRAGVAVHALAGDPRWGKPQYHHIPMDWVEAVLRFNRQSRPEERFDGLHSDVEVYLLTKSWAEHPAEMLGGYLDMNAKVAEAAHREDPTFFFGADIPFWFDDDPNYRIAWRGQIKFPAQHVIDTVDGVTVMAYRNFAEGPDGTVNLVLSELRYAQAAGKPVQVGQETQENMYPPYISFGGTSCGRMEGELQRIQGVCSAYASFDGFAIHHYESFRKLCS